MRYFLTSIIISALVFSCNPDKNKRPELENQRFSTRDDAKLFFKNLRRQAYDLEEMPAAKLEVLRHENRTLKADYPLLQLAIVMNWRFDEAYLLIEPNAYFSAGEPFTVQWQDPVSQQSGTYTFGQGNKEEHLRFASQLYSSILDGHQFMVLSDSLKQPILTLPKEREVFRITMLDYFRLTGNIR